MSCLYANHRWDSLYLLHCYNFNDIHFFIFMVSINMIIILFIRHMRLSILPTAKLYASWFLANSMSSSIAVVTLTWSFKIAGRTLVAWFFVLCRFNVEYYTCSVSTNPLWHVLGLQCREHRWVMNIPLGLFIVITGQDDKRECTPHRHAEDVGDA